MRAQNYEKVHQIYPRSTCLAYFLMIPVKNLKIKEKLDNERHEYVIGVKLFKQYFFMVL